jgi:hypothetical protein
MLLQLNLSTWNIYGRGKKTDLCYGGTYKYPFCIFLLWNKVPGKIWQICGDQRCIRKSTMQMFTYSLKSTLALQFKLGCNLLVIWFFSKLIWFFSTLVLFDPVTALVGAAPSFSGAPSVWSFCCSLINLLSFIRKIKSNFYNVITT